MKKILILIILSIISYNSYSQGCIAIKGGSGGMCVLNVHDMDTTKWELNTNSRYFISFRHYSGENHTISREILGTNVINHTSQTDFTLIHKLSPRWSYGIDIPLVSNTRSSLYEHNNVGRFQTNSFGLGDIRFTLYTYLVDPAKRPKANLQVGLGIKLPSGNDNVQDYFHVTDSTKRLGPVDQSIQLGDGGTGLTLELNGYLALLDNLNLYGNFYYLSNPQDVNGVSTAHGGTPSSNAVKNTSDVMSVPDQYMVRGGLNYRIGHFTFTGGVRREAVPIYDLIGKSDGFRRPGFIISAEPGITYSNKRVNFYVYAPYALIRDRTQSVPDKISTQLTGVYTRGDAAFADYFVMAGFTLKF